MDTYRSDCYTTWFGLCQKIGKTKDIIEKGEEHCGHLIEAHKECMRALGFKI